MSSRSRGPLLLFALAAVLAIGAWLIGFGTALYLEPPSPQAPESHQVPSNFEMYDEAWEIVAREFYGKMPEERDVANHAVDGMIAALGDPYAAYLDRTAATVARDAFEPEVVGGIGAWIEPITDGALVLSVVPDTPAERIGMEPGDRILAVDMTPIAGMDRDAILDEMRGEAGSSVVLIMLRGQGAPFTVEAVRDDFDLPIVEVRQPENGVAYLRITHFAPDLVAELDEALASISGQGADSLIVDLRDNPGGDLDTIRQVAGRFVDGDLYVELDRAGNETSYSTETSDVPDIDLPSSLIVLVNSGTASAAEMLAGILQESAGAHLVGTPTFGKGSIQVVSELTDGSVIRLTVAEWRTPAGTVVEGEGLSPDELVEITADDREQGLDPQLEAALRTASRLSQAAGG